MANFSPGRNFSPANGAEIVLRYTLCINGCQLEVLLRVFKLAQLTLFESKNSFELSTQKRG